MSPAPKMSGPRQQGIEQRAREAFLRLQDDDVSPIEITEWEAWMQADPRHAAAFDAVADAWSLGAHARLDEAPSWQLRADAYDGSVPVKQWRGRPQRRPALAWGMAAAAACVCVGAISAWQWPARVQPLAMQIETTRGQQKEAALPDGSKLVLGGQTALDIAFGAHRRDITLRTGEAEFQVAHDRSRPFVVKTRLGEMTAVGTVFDIAQRSDAVTLTVIEGVVAVDSFALKPNHASAETAPLRVSAGQRLTIDGAGARLDRVDDRGPPSWTSGRLEYRSQTLAHVLEDVNRYAQAPIVLQDPSLGKLTYTGTVQLSDIPAWAQSLGGAFPLDVEATPEGGYVLKKKNVAGPLQVSGSKAS